MVVEANKSAVERVPDWVSKLDNLLSAIEIYRDIEEQAMTKIRMILKEKGIVISAEEMKSTNVDQIRERLNQTREERMKREQQVKHEANEKAYEREEERGCRR